MSTQLYSPPANLWEDHRRLRERLAAKERRPAAPFTHAPMPVPGVVRSTRSWYLPIKTLADFVGACLLLVMLGPVIFLAAIATKIASPGPAFYKQTRMGRDGREFRIWKIRTMMHNAESATGAVWSQENDPRVTRLGRYLRNSHIDEFPQLFQIVTGEMSLIGPRPERPEFIHHLQWKVPRYTERLSVKPGVTGLAQMLLPPDSDTDGVRRKVQCDLYYVRHLSPWLDARILIQTAWLFVRSVAGSALMPFRLPSTDVVQRQMGDITEY